MPTAKTKWILRRVLPFGIIWLVLGWIFMLVEAAAIRERGGTSTTAIELDLRVFLFASLAVTLIGLLVGLFEVAFLERKLARLSFLRKLLYKLLIYFFLFSLVIFITYPLAASLEMEVGLFDKLVWSRYLEFLGSITYLSTLFQLTVSLVVSLLYLEVSDQLGRGVLVNFFTGKYHKPLEERRVFMFLDMRASTSIAEELGHIRYFRMLKEYYDDLSAAVIRYGGRVYQYVGDEMVVTWPLDAGTRHANCLRCYFDMQADLARRASLYEERFGIAPSFKAGLHCGEVTTGEIGQVKKEILHTGDVLNVAARIQSLCNTYGVGLLLSDELLQELRPLDGYTAESIGQIALKGRKETMRLWTVGEKVV